MEENKTTYLYWSPSGNNPMYEDIPAEAWNSYENLKAFLLPCLHQDKQSLCNENRQILESNEQRKDHVIIIGYHIEVIMCNDAISNLDKLEKQKDIIKQKFLEALKDYAQYKCIEYKDINYYSNEILSGIYSGKKLYNKDISKARNSIYMPVSKNLKRICKNLKPSWSNYLDDLLTEYRKKLLEDLEEAEKKNAAEEIQEELKKQIKECEDQEYIDNTPLTLNTPALFGIIMASAIYGYYLKYNTMEEHTTFTAYKIAEIVQGKAPQKNKIELYEMCLWWFDIMEKLPISMHAYGNIKPQDAHVTSAWSFIHDPYITLKPATYKNCDNMLKDFIPGTEFIKLDRDLLNTEALQMCKTVQQICIYYYLALLVTEIRAQDNKELQIKLADLYTLIEAQDTTPQNKSNILNKTIMGILDKWTEQGIILTSSIDGQGHKNEYVNVVLA